MPTRSRIDELLDKLDPPKARLIFALDATASRQPTWDQAAVLQAEMFEAAASIGNLHCQLVYYRGYNGECRSSQWFNNAKLLSDAMMKITCLAGHTQIEKVIKHAVREHAREPIAGLILISDACEEVASDLYAAAHELTAPVFLFQEGRSDLVAGVYTRIAEITKGAVAQFDNVSAGKLVDLLKAVAVFATGGVTALAAQRTKAATLLLSQMKR
jgi:hypothetical protein